MSKSIGKVFGSGSTGTYGYENNYLNYLNNYNTKNYDETLNNMTSTALNMSQNLSSMPNYQFAVDASDAARQRAENATYQAAVNQIMPQYAQQMTDLQTQLANQGIPVGSEAYNRAMGSLQAAQSSALQQAALQSVQNGQNAFTQSLNDSINAAQFGNTAQQNYVDQILSLLKNSVSGYQNQENIYNTNSGIQSRITQAEQSGWDNLINSAKTGAKYF